MRKILVIVAALAGLAVMPQAQANDRVGVFVIGAVTGAIVGHVLSDHDHHYDRGPRVVEHHYYEAPRRRVREVHHYHHKAPHYAKPHGRPHHIGHRRHH